MITDEQVREALEANADRDTDGKWHFRGSIGWPYEEASALAITRACLILDVPVGVILTGETWCALVVRLAALEERFAHVAGMGA